MVTNLGKEKGLVFAADLPKLEENLAVVSEISANIDAVKLGSHLITRYSVNIVREFQQICGLPLIVDLKLLDVPHILHSVAEISFETGADGLTLSGLCGARPIDEIVDKWPQKMVIVFNELSYVGGLLPPQISDETARIALEVGAFGILAPGTKPDRIACLRRIVGDKLVILSCGIGKQGPTYGSTVEAGADYEIVGRSIYLAENPANEAAKARAAIKGPAGK